MRVFSLLGPAIGLLLAGSALGDDGSYRLVEVDNPVFRPNVLFSPAEDLSSPRFRGLREKYRLDDVIQGEEDEFRRILLLRHWLRQHVVVKKGMPATGDPDALRMLEESPRGGGYHCGHFDKMQAMVLNAMGHVTRIIFAGAGEEEARLSGSHGIDEVWVNSLCKWVMVDGEHDSHFEKDGVPLSALEIRKEVWRDGAKNVFRHQGPERRKLARERDDTWGRTPRTYAWVSWSTNVNRESTWTGAKRDDGRVIVLDDEQWRNGTWYRSGRKHWAYAANYFRPVKDEGAIYWTPNVLKVDPVFRGVAAEVKIESDTPNFREYQISEDGTTWRTTGKAFVLNLSKERHEWQLRSVNTAGVGGPVYRLVVERR